MKNHFDVDLGTNTRVRSISSEGSLRDLNRSKVRTRVANILNIKDKIRECLDSDNFPETVPIVIISDVTASREKDINQVDKKIPEFIGKLVGDGVIESPQFCIGAVGDAKSDKAPIQISQFESDNRLDEILEKLWAEKGGGGTGEESYELIALYFARRTKLSANERGKKGYLFILGDEAPYPTVSKEEALKWLGFEIEKDLSTEKVFKEVQEKFHTFFIFPKRTIQEKMKGIDEEIRKRVIDAGGMYDNTDVRFSLIWGNYNDADLHVIDPRGDHIYFGSYKGKGHNSPTGGNLDVDANGGVATTRKPVENIRWPKGKAPKGKYKVWVRNFAYHENSHDKYNFIVEVQIGTKVETFEKTMLPRRTGESSDIKIGTFDYDPADFDIENEVDEYDAYENDIILEKWKKLIPEENILTLKEPDSVMDVIMGVLVISEEKKSLSEYIQDLKDSGTSEGSQKKIEECLNPISRLYSTNKVNSSIFTKSTNKKSKSKRL